MKILSWDVGIKNLAYCIIERKKDKDTFTIIEWDVINLAEKGEKCQFNNCKLEASYCITNKTTNEISLVCRRHKDKYIPKLVNIDNLSIKNKKCCLCDNMCCCGIEHTENNWCVDHQKNANKFVKNIKCKKYKKSCMKTATLQLTTKLYTILKTKSTLLEVDEVLIENQPTFINPTMKTISALLYSYFVIYGMIEGHKIKDIKFVSPSNKLKINIENTNGVLKDSTKANAYKLTKKLGIQYCSALINENDKKILETHTKKDDMCDSFLQGFQYLFSPLPMIYFTKLQSIGFDDTKKKRKPKKNKETKE